MDRPTELARPPNKEILRSNPEVYWQEGMGRQGNLEAVFGSHKQSNPEFWKRIAENKVWVRPNMASPDNPESCTNAQALEVSLRQLLQSGVKNIQVGDIPGLPQLESMPKDSTGYIEAYKKLFDSLGYTNVIRNLRLEFANAAIQIVDPQKFQQSDLKVEETTLATIVKPDADLIVNLVLPKEHGQYHFSCGTKSMVGMMTPESRMTIHDHGSDLVQDIVNRMALEAQRQGKSLNDRSVVHQLYIDAYVEAANQSDEKNSLIMSTIMGKTTENLQNKGVQILTIVDGTSFLTGHEHVGKNESLDMAAIGLNPLAVDLAMSKRLGVSAPYIERMKKQYGVEPQTVGKVTKEIPLRKRKRISRDVKFDGDNFTFSYAIQAELPVGGFSGPKQEKIQQGRNSLPQSEEKIKPKPEEIHIKRLAGLRKALRNFEYIYSDLRRFTIRNRLEFHQDESDIANIVMDMIKPRIDNFSNEIKQIRSTYDWTEIDQILKLDEQNIQNYRIKNPEYYNKITVLKKQCYEGEMKAVSLSTLLRWVSGKDLGGIIYNRIQDDSNLNFFQKNNYVKILSKIQNYYYEKSFNVNGVVTYHRT